jgi:hypothetical protein
MRLGLRKRPPLPLRQHTANISTEREQTHLVFPYVGQVIDDGAIYGFDSEAHMVRKLSRFASSGAISVTPEGMIRVHTSKVTALHLPVKGLMDLLGLETQQLLNTKRVDGVGADNDDLVLDPEKLLPPPHMHGHLTSLKIENGVIDLTFGPENGKPAPAPIPESCGARNYLHFTGGSVRFGKLTMSGMDLELVDASPAESFDFAIDHYDEQLMAGYSKMTRTGGLCVHMPDYDKLKPPASAKK